ncbi:MAG: hypothetical protein HY276_03455 [Ignavibacteriales bacterium]|nr:hypothetical protein [Ignavibacteriales bacterium]
MSKVKEQTAVYSVRKKQAKGSQVLTPRKAGIRLLQQMEDDATSDDIIYEMYVLQKANKGLRELNEGKVVSHEEVKKQLHRWLK